MTHSTFHFYLLVFAAVAIALVVRYLRRRFSASSPPLTLWPSVKQKRQWWAERGKGNPGKRNSKWSKA